jgi:hypothetical protein
MQEICMGDTEGAECDRVRVVVVVVVVVVVREQMSTAAALPHSYCTAHVP